MVIAERRRLMVLCYAFFCVSCLLAGVGVAQPFFMDATKEMGAGLFSSRGLASGDYNNDSLPDLFFSHNNAAQIKLLRNTGRDRFVDDSSIIQSEIPSKRMGGGPVWGDYDNDGDLDLFVSIGAWEDHQRNGNMLLRNDRGVFVDVAVASGLTDVQSTDNAVWMDYDRDGLLDLYTGNLGNSTSRNLLYHNKGDGSFVDVTEQAGLNIPFNPETGGSNGGIVAGDFNDDGWPDLYIAVFGWAGAPAPNRLFLNNGQGGFIDATTSDIAHEGEAFGVATGDIDNDGDLDLFFASGGSTKSVERSGALLNLGNAQFIDVTASLGLVRLMADNLIGGINIADIDNQYCGHFL
ncbi:VCBS repeat-containing protein [Candidatus Bathyarchaeota archaeon]|nr:VCBS repeat-containing protein [Candidatus Bathyarchaeota archaeon]